MRSESPRSHHTHINEAGAGGVRVSIMERSSDQVSTQISTISTQIYTISTQISTISTQISTLYTHIFTLSTISTLFTQISNQISTLSTDNSADQHGCPLRVGRGRHLQPQAAQAHGRGGAHAQVMLCNPGNQASDRVIAGSWVTTLSRTRPATASRTR